MMSVQPGLLNWMAFSALESVLLTLTLTMVLPEGEKENGLGDQMPFPFVLICML